MDMISLLPTIFQFSPFSLGSSSLPSNSTVGGGYCALLQIAAEILRCTESPSVSPGQGFDMGPSDKASRNFGDFLFKVPKTALKFIWFSVCFSANYKSIQITLEQKLFEKVSENL